VLAEAAPLTEGQYQHLFSRFVDQYQKKYELAQFFERYNIFKSNLDYIVAHNLRADKSYTLAMNQFGDLTTEEFSRKYLQSASSNTETSVAQLHNGLVNSADIPERVDWREKGAVTPVVDQGECSAGYAFSTAGAIEGATFIKTNKLIALSKQQIIDCSGSFGNRGCQGGTAIGALQYISWWGSIYHEDCYPYLGKDQHYCNAGCPESRTLIDGFARLNGTEAGLKQAVASTPISVFVDAESRDFRFYSGGLYDGPCSKSVNHGALVVGYGTTVFDTQYWILKNSWGLSWGEQGYMRLIGGSNVCGIANNATIVYAK